MVKSKLLLLLVLIIISTACSRFQRPIPNNSKLELEEVRGMDRFTNISGVKIEGDKFYFTALEGNRLNYYYLSLVNNEVKRIFKHLGDYETLIPMKEDNFVFIDYRGTLKYIRDNKEITIDHGITGENYPNILVSPDKSMILYTKEIDGKQGLFKYDVKKRAKSMIISKLDEEDYKSFMESILSNGGDYFVLNNREVYDIEGNRIVEINGTSIRWSPNDKWIAYIQASNNAERIYIGEGSTRLGNSFCIYSMEESKELRLFESEGGFINPIDVIQWSRDSNIVAISTGRVTLEERYFQSIDFDRILVYKIKEKKKVEVKDMSYNFYEILFNSYIYANNLGQRQSSVIVALEDSKRNTIKEPLLLNNRDMFVINLDNQGYFIEGRSLMKIDATGEHSEVYTLPWDVDQLYYHEGKNIFIILDVNKRVYLLQ